MLVLWTLCVSGVAMVTRILWVYILLWGPERLTGRGGASWRDCALKAWCGMRGVLSLAAALAIPLATDAGRPFPDRGLVIFLTYGTVVTTLLVHGLTLPSLVPALGVTSEDDAGEEAAARARAAEAALTRADQLEREGRAPAECLEELRRAYDRQRRRYAARADRRPDDGAERATLDCARLHRELLGAEHEAVIRLREEGRVSEDVLQELQHDLDLAHARLEE
jgi:NhaP-type Na+/H+ or K+/H+ antiporter